MDKSKHYKVNTKTKDSSELNKSNSTHECNDSSIDSFIRSNDDSRADMMPSSKRYLLKLPITKEDFAAAHSAWNAGGWRNIYLRGIQDLDYCALDEMLEYINEYVPYRTAEKYEYKSPGGGYYSSITYNKEIMYIREPPDEKKEIYGRFLAEVIDALDCVQK